MTERLPSAIERAGFGVTLTWYRAEVQEPIIISYGDVYPTQVIPEGTTGWVQGRATWSIFVPDELGDYPERVNTRESGLHVMDDYCQATYTLPEWYWNWIEEEGEA